MTNRSNDWAAYPKGTKVDFVVTEVFGADGLLTESTKGHVFFAHQIVADLEVGGGVMVSAQLQGKATLVVDHSFAGGYLILAAGLREKFFATLVAPDVA